MKGFILRVGLTGNAFCVEKKVGGTTLRVTIGDAAVWSAEDARERAREMLKEIDQKGEVVTATKTLADVWRIYREQEWPKLSATMKNDRRRHWELRIEPVMGGKKLNAVTRADCTALHRSVKAPVEANRVIETLRRLYGYASDELEWHDGRNPAQKIKRNPEEGRQDYFSPDEISALLEVLPVNASGDVIRTLTFTGARPAEVFGMTWSQVDLKTRTWTKPAASTKQRKTHRVPLNDAAIEVISRQPRRGLRVFTRENGGPVITINEAWRKALSEAGLTYHRIYDLRHSMASLLAANGVSLQTIGAVLGHSKIATTQRYAHLDDDHVREAVNVVQFPKSKAG